MEENPILYHLGEALRLARLENATSAVGLHIVNALATFGSKGQDKVRAADQARRNRSNTGKAVPASNAREWKPGEQMGKPTGLPAQEVIVSPMQPGKPAQPRPQAANPLPEKKVVPVAEIKLGVTAQEASDAIKQFSKDVASQAGTPFSRIETYKNAAEITRPTKALELFGVEQIRAYLKLKGKAVPDTNTDRQAGAALIAHFQNKGE